MQREKDTEHRGDNRTTTVVMRRAMAVDLHCLVVRASDLSTAESATSTLSTLVHSLVGTNHLVTACLHTLTLDTHRCGVGATGCAVNHLLGHNESLLMEQIDTQCKLYSSFYQNSAYRIVFM